MTIFKKDLFTVYSNFSIPYNLCYHEHITFLLIIKTAPKVVGRYMRNHDETYTFKRSILKYIKENRKMERRSFSR